jgi:hypothetical protein
LYKDSHDDEEHKNEEECREVCHEQWWSGSVNIDQRRRCKSLQP